MTPIPHGAQPLTPRAAYSLRRRLLAWLLVSTAVIGTIAMVDTWDEAVDTANDVSDRVLAGSALAIAERVIVAEDGSLEVDIPYVALEMLTSAAQDRVFYRVDGPPGKFITGYQTLPSIPRREGQAAAFENATFRGEPIRVAALARSASTGINSVPFTVTVAETTIARQQLTQTILIRSALRLLFMIVGAAIIVWVAVTLSLRPLYRFSEAIAERSPDDLHPIGERVPNEVQGLVDTVNSFMVRLESALEALRHFTGNASHQLRTPLAIIRTQLALADRATELGEVKEAARKADEAVADAEHILAQLLLMAKIDAATRSASMQRVDLTALARGATADNVPLGADAGIDLGFEGEGEIMVSAEPLLIGELMKNLIGNALLYAGNGAEVTVRVKSGDGIAVLEVEDDGPGIPPEKRASVLKRFDRGDRSDKLGTGLGLPIVEEIARLHGATVILADGREGKGLKVEIRFPVAG
jgi:two-component system sensor histidine kinase TctE|nr:sensor histidine kinase [Neorhizobium tomejilense]